MMKKDKLLYLMAIPGILFFIVFHYVPMYGILIAFKKYNLYQGFSGSPWIGLDNFVKLFGMGGFRRALGNTIIISFYQLFFAFPAPIILAIMLNEVRHMLYKRFVQTVIYLPHFVSWIIIAGILYAFFSPSTGVIKEIARYSSARCCIWRRSLRSIRSCTKRPRWTGRRNGGKFGILRCRG
jgi:putative aldouronate transport system permease protein